MGHNSTNDIFLVNTLTDRMIAFYARKILRCLLALLLRGGPAGTVFPAGESGFIRFPVQHAAIVSRQDRRNRYVPRLGCLTCFNTINRDSIQRRHSG